MYLLCSRVSCDTARNLRDYIQEQTGRRLFIRWESHPRHLPIIRFGNADNEVVKDTSYNHPMFIRMCSNKLCTSTVLRESNINSPDFHILPYDVTYPCVIRTTMIGHGGVGIHIATNEEEFDEVWQGGFYWTPFINLSSEYRVIIFNGEVLKIFKKIREGDREEFPIRNNSNDYHFSVRENLEAFPNLVDFITTKLNPLFPIGFYGLDIGKIRDSEDFFVLELNSAPGLNTNTTTVLGDKLIEALEL